MRILVSVVLLGSLLAPSVAVASPERTAALLSEYQHRKTKVVVEAAQEHLRVGSWARDAGLVAQATAEFLKAVEVAEGRYNPALKVLAIMRRLEGKFWKRELKSPSAGMIRAYDKRARKARRKLETERLKLAKWAHKKKELQDEAFSEYQALVARMGGALETNAKGQIVLEFGKIPAEVSARILEASVTINAKRYVRDEVLATVPNLDGLHEAASADLRVRTERGAENAKWFLDAAEALLPFLQEDTGGRPTIRLDLYIFETREAYGTFLDSVGLSEHRVASGLADGKRKAAIVCGEGFDDTTVLGLVFHELAHLYQYCVTPTIMPSWYAEGFAETWGGQGTYAWDSATLQAGDVMRSHRVDEIKTDAGYIPLSELIGADALKLLTTDKDRALRFYAESWAFYRYMRQAAPKEIRKRFRQWELKCKGAALGAEAGKHHSRNMGPASALFRQTFGDDLPTLEAGFRTWLGEL